MSDDRLRDRLLSLISLPAETEWVEFKVNNADPNMIGRTASALANSAALRGEPLGWIAWGIQDGSHEIVGTSFNPHTTLVGNQPLEHWLSQRFQPDCAFHFQTVDIEGKAIVLLEIPAAARAPTAFDQVAYIRIGSSTPKLVEHSERQRQLWQKITAVAFEQDIAATGLSMADVLANLDVQSCFDLLKQPFPDGRVAILDRLEAEGLIKHDVGDRWNVLNLGALLFAKKLDRFGRLGRKAVRVVLYKGRQRVEAVREQVSLVGYASGFTALMGFVTSLLPVNELIGRALREQHPIFPEIALRELIANALLHQDLSVTGAGPMIEIFDDRVEISNPGLPLVAPDRFLDLPPRSRNEAMASLMRRMNICEERGSGIDKVISAAEMYQLPPPDFRSIGDNTRAVLFSPRPFSGMDRNERVRAAYQHAGLMWV